MKIRDELGSELGGKAALAGLKIICQLCANSDNDRVGTGNSKSFRINLQQGKNTEERSERIDIEFAGIGGRDDLSNEVITKFIKAYKKIIRKS